MEIYVFMFYSFALTSNINLQENYLTEYWKCTRRHCITGESITIKPDNSVLIKESDDHVRSPSRSKGIWEKSGDTIQLELSRERGVSYYLLKESHGLIFLVSLKDIIFWDGIIESVDSALGINEDLKMFKEFKANDESLREKAVQSIIMETFNETLFSKEPIRDIYVSRGFVANKAKGVD